MSRPPPAPVADPAHSHDEAVRCFATDSSPGSNMAAGPPDPHAHLREKAAREYDSGQHAAPRRGRDVARLALCLSAWRLRRAQAALQPRHQTHPRPAASRGGPVLCPERGALRLATSVGELPHRQPASRPSGALQPPGDYSGGIRSISTSWQPGDDTATCGHPTCAAGRVFL